MRMLIEESEELDVEKTDIEAGGEINGGHGHRSMHSGSSYSSVADALWNCLKTLEA